MTKELLLQIKSIQSATKDIERVRQAASGLAKEALALNKASAASGAGMDKATSAARRNAAEVKKLDKVLMETIKALEAMRAKVTALEKTLNELTGTINKTSGAAERGNKNLRQMGDVAKAMARTTTEGFKAMLISQAAWTAGFALIFAPMYKFGQLLGEAIDLDNQFARSVRVLYPATTELGEALDQAFAKVSEEMIRTGESSERVNEVLYQLGSAGLSAEEAMAALGTTMDVIVGTEADVTTLTKLVAGVYNNMADSIMRASDGSIVFVGASTQMTDQLKNNVTQTEKFVAINDVLVEAFDRHQIEMSEMVDGLKYAISTATQVGISFTEVVGILATLNDHMIKAGTAGRSFQSLLSQIAKNPDKFKEAFNVEFDATKPIQILDIFRQLNKELSGGFLTVEELGRAFDRTGLRGAKSLITLAINYDELVANVKELETTAVGAAKRMADVMLDTPAKAIARLHQAMVLLTRSIFEIPIFIFTELLHIINAVVAAAFVLNNALGGIPGTIFKIGAAVGGLLLIVKVVAVLITHFKIVETAAWAVVNAFVAFGTGGIKAIFVGLGGAIGSLVGQLKILGVIALSAGKLIISGLTASFAVLGVTLAPIVAWIVAIGAAVAAGVYIWKRLTDQTDNTGRSLKEIQKQMGDTIDPIKDVTSELIGFHIAAEQLASSNALLFGIEIGSIDEYAGAMSELQIIAQHINETLLGRTAILGEEFAINGKILQQYKNIAETKIKDIEFAELDTDPEERQKQINKLLQEAEQATKAWASAYGALLDKQKSTADLTQSFRDYINQVRFGFETYDALINGIGNAEDAAEKFAKTSRDSMVENVASVTEGYNKIFDSVTRNNEAVERQKDILSGARIAYEELKRSGTASGAEIQRAYQMVEHSALTLNDLVETANTALLPEFTEWWKRVGQVGPEAQAKLNAELERTKEAINANNEKLMDMNRELSSLGVESIEGLSRIADIFDQGASSGIKLADEAREAGDKIKALAEDVKQARDEYQKLQESGSDFEKLQEASEKLTELEQKHSKAISDRQNTQTRANAILAQAAALNQREQAAIQASISLMGSQAAKYRQIGEDSSRSMEQRLAAFGAEKKALEDQRDLVTKNAEAQQKALEVARAKGEVTEEEFFAKQRQLYEKSASAYEGLSRKIVQSQESAIEQQGDAGEKLQQKLNDIQTALVSVNQSIADVVTRVSSVDFSAVADELGSVFAKAKEEMDKLRGEIAYVQNDLNTLVGKEYTIKIRKKITETTESEQFGGLAGFAASTYVSAGEGFVPPSFVKSHLPTLQALNAGNAVPVNGAIPLSRFVGPSGVDNIRTSLPRGSFVLSKRGVEAFERATGAVSERNNYQMGGVVAQESDVTALSPPETHETSMFELTLNLGAGETKRYPLYGSKATINEIKEHLERQNLTKL